MLHHQLPHTIYVLALHNNKYYVGQSKNVYRTLRYHFNYWVDNELLSSEWVKKYTPYRIEKLVRNCQPHELDYYTVHYMKQYGIDNVRGGTYSRIKLSLADRMIIEREMRTEGENARQIMYI